MDNGKKLRRVETGVATGDGTLASHLKTRWLFNAKVTLIHMDGEKKLFHGGI